MLRVFIADDETPALDVNVGVPLPSMPTAYTSTSVSRTTSTTSGQTASCHEGLRLATTAWS